MYILGSCIAFFILSLLFTGYMRHYALKKNIIDNPNERSSHSVPTPRGGGVAVVLSYLLALSFLIYTNQLNNDIGLTLIGAGLVISVLGFLDDHGHINSMIRLAIHFIAAISAVASLGGFSAVAVFNGFQLGFAANIIAVLFLVWLLNLYNFMDGINGIASAEAITSALSMAFLYWMLSPVLNFQALLLLAAAVSGFMLWNFPKAKIFMGDACSGFLGLTLGILALYALKQDLALFCAWLICLGVFIVDATYTLIRRILTGHKMYDAHRSHAYQILSRKVGSHTPVTLCVAAINILWLFPIAYLVASQDYTYPELGILIAYMPLIACAVIVKAGDPYA
ncbi:glycosyltransferase family 4 protein [Acinetobacter sp.]|uniref:MraY family glycosyltransferase n=1 Tax=Acinetobacter sp. TaxID=472 RepID=UPI0035ADB86D